MLLTLKQASQWASKHLNKNVTTANISYLIQYGHLETSPEKGTTLIPLQSLEDYYGQSRREKQWKDELGDDLNWTLSFEKIKEAETTKHVRSCKKYVRLLVIKSMVTGIKLFLALILYMSQRCFRCCKR